MNLTRRSFVGAAAGLAGVAALTPLARALPKPVGMVLLEPARFSDQRFYEMQVWRELAPGRTLHQWRYRAVWTLEPFTGGFEPREIKPCVFEYEFTEEERPGTGGGIAATVPEIYQAFQVEPGIWLIDVDLLQFGNRIPDKPLWIRAEGVTWR